MNPNPSPAVNSFIQALGNQAQNIPAQNIPAQDTQALKLHAIASQSPSEAHFISTIRSPDFSYAMTHRPRQNGQGHDISKVPETSPEWDPIYGGGSIPADVYTHPEWYTNMRDKPDQESFKAITAMHNKPDLDVNIYRAGPHNQLNHGDWVTLSKEYAKGESNQESTPVHTFKVKAKDIQFAGDSINEFGYFPTDATLKEAYAKARGQLLPT